MITKLSKNPQLSLRKKLLALMTSIVAGSLNAVGLVIPSAEAVGMKSVGGSIACTALWPTNQWVRGTATARGTVDFQMQSHTNFSSTAYYINLGYSSVYVPWGYTFAANRGGPFYAYGLTSIGAVTKISRFCT